MWVCVSCRLQSDWSRTKCGAFGIMYFVFCVFVVLFSQKWHETQTYTKREPRWISRITLRQQLFKPTILPKDYLWFCAFPNWEQQKRWKMAKFLRQKHFWLFDFAPRIHYWYHGSILSSIYCYRVRSIFINFPLSKSSTKVDRFLSLWI